MFPSNFKATGMVLLNKITYIHKNISIKRNPVELEKKVKTVVQEVCKIIWSVNIFTHCSSHIQPVTQIFPRKSLQKDYKAKFLSIKCKPTAIFHQEPLVVTIDLGPAFDQHIHVVFRNYYIAVYDVTLVHQSIVSRHLEKFLPKCALCAEGETRHLSKNIALRSPSSLNTFKFNRYPVSTVFQHYHATAFIIILLIASAWWTLLFHII